jgi:predicted dehydrogenase
MSTDITPNLEQLIKAFGKADRKEQRLLLRRDRGFPVSEYALEAASEHSSEILDEITASFPNLTYSQILDLTDQYTHHIDLIRWLVGENEEVHPSQKPQRTK